ncbi:cryptochrome/photolyase family protein [Aequorivita echinoideorum]|uniref:Cryptochrome/photolyase family protein n=1 Tax=Aequorivita echinoideorum TaxID=1549647 RepID=A0ABS5S1E5_9FLAO|nr:cryptochrome/photolyase family protein [Aequorivita echinoideorum]MBT0606798.1 cryptochrome/photolyase family protein [Aequorivita echinoideorum]
MKKLRLILGDQLNYKHSWFDKTEKDTLYFMAEMRQETDYAHHHIQKIVAFFSAMRNFYDHFKSKGHQFIYYEIDAQANKQKLVENLNELISKYSIEKFEYQLPDEYRLDKQLRTFCEDLGIESEVFDTEHFYTSRTEMADFYEGKKEMTMEYFYRHMRKKHDILITGKDSPEGGKWNFDKSNRNKWDEKTEIPHERGFRKDVSEIVKQIEKQKVKTIGTLNESSFSWPTSRADSLSVLNYFCDNLLVHFGDFQDAMHTEEKFLFHSRLSFSMNSKMLSPKEIIEKVIETYYRRKSEIAISEVEGFIRQILGWREYMRGIYWMKMPGYAKENKLENKNKLPDFYWTGKTKMNCLHHAVTQSLVNAYAHHIQRLMVTGNFALLTQVHPDEVEAWYLGIYIDAIEWVEMPNTRGMSQYADDGIVATKPYISSGSYINKMSNYCKNCFYDVNKKTGEKACPFNSLYWNFLSEKKAHFENNNRMNMMLSLLDKMKSETLKAHLKRAQEIIKNPDKF